MVPETEGFSNGIYCQFGPFFVFYLNNDPKIQNFEKMEKAPGGIIIQMMIIWYTIPEIWHVTDSIFVSYFGLVFLS